MTLYAIWPYFVLVFVVSIACGRLPPFKLVDDARADGGMRTETLDGLRGFLALSVFVHHLVITHRYLQSGTWDYPPSAFYTLSGTGRVRCLLYDYRLPVLGKLLDARGRPDWWTLYLGRVFRIGPMYVLVVALMLFVVAYRTDFQLREPLARVCISVSEWLALGVFPQQPEVNGYQATGLILRRRDVDHILRVGLLCGLAAARDNCPLAPACAVCRHWLGGVPADIGLRADADGRVGEELR